MDGDLRTQELDDATDVWTPQRRRTSDRFGNPTTSRSQCTKYCTGHCTNLPQHQCTEPHGLHHPLARAAGEPRLLT